MKIFKIRHIVTVIATAFFVLLVSSSTAQAATSPTLDDLLSYSVLGGAAVTCTGATTVTGDVGVSPGTSITGFPSTAGPCTVGPPGTEHSNDASAIAAQAENLAVFGALDQTCDQSYPSGQDLTLVSPLVPGVYCSEGSFLLTGNLTLSGAGVWIFKTVSTLITSPGSSVTGGDPCNIWWRIGSSTTLDTTTSFVGNVLSQNGVNAMNTGATLNGRFLGLEAATVTLDTNTISGPVCVDSAGPGGDSDDSGGDTTTTPGLPDTASGTQKESKAALYTAIASGIFLAPLSIYAAKKRLSTRS